MKRLLIILAIIPIFSYCGDSGQKTSNDIEKHKYTQEYNPVEVVELTKQTFSKELVSNGKLSARYKSAISFTTQGVVSSINFSNGDHVSKGSVIASIDNTAALNSLKSDQYAMDKAKIDMTDVIIGFGYSTPIDTTAIPAERLVYAKVRSGFNTAKIGLETAKKNLTDCKLIAPISGRIANLNIKPFETSKPEFCTVIDDSSFDVEFTILETEKNFISQGQSIRVSTFSNPNKYVVGKIVNINPTVNSSGQIAVKAEITNNGDMLDGMNVKIFIENNISNQLIVPRSAVVIRDNLQVLFKYSKGKALWTYIHTVMENSKEYVIIANESRGAEIAVGDSIIVSGNLNLADNSSVEIKR